MFTVPLVLIALLAPAQAALDIRAERVELRHQDGVVRFEGQVVATQGDLTLRCAALTARYRDDGELDSLDARGAVTVVAKGLEASAEHARYERSTGTLVLAGAPRVTRGADRLTGQRIVFWPDEGRVVVEGARGTFAAPDLSRLARPAQ